MAQLPSIVYGCARRAGAHGICCAARGRGRHNPAILCHAMERIGRAIRPRARCGRPIHLCRLCPLCARHRPIVETAFAIQEISRGLPGWWQSTPLCPRLRGWWQKRSRQYSKKSWPKFHWIDEQSSWRISISDRDPSGNWRGNSRLRDQVDELLINGFAESAMRLGARNVWLEPDRDVAVALFCDGRDVRETAAFLGKSVQEIREAKERLKSVFANLLKARSGSSMSSPSLTPASWDSPENQPPDQKPPCDVLSPDGNATEGHHTRTHIQKTIPELIPDERGERDV